MKGRLSPRNTSIQAAFGISIVALFVLASAFSEQVPFLARLELEAYDIRLRATMSRTVDPRIVIIDVDERTLAIEGRWPLGRDKWMALLQQLFDVYHVKVVGFDVIFADPDASSGLAVLERLGTSELKSSKEFQRILNHLRPTLDYDARFAAEIQGHPVVLSFAGQNKLTTESPDLQLATLPQPAFAAASFPNPPISLAIDGYSGNLIEFQTASVAGGHAIPLIDLDGVMRRLPMFVRFKDGYYECLAAAIFRTYLENEPIRIRVREDKLNSVVRLTSAQIGRSAIALDDSGAVLVPYRGDSPMFRYISATDIIRGNLNPGELEGRIALVGTSAQGVLDLHNTPVSEVYPGIEVHASLLSGLLDNRIKAKPQYESVVNGIILAAIGLPLAMLLRRFGPLLSAVITAGVALALIGFNFYWWYNDIVLALAMPLLMIVSLYIASAAYGFYTEARAKKVISDIFGTYVPKQLVEEMAKNPDAYTWKGESREMTVLFSDIRNFTAISEGLSAAELTAMMNAYLSAMTNNIQEHRGTIDKYIGDAIMAFWGAPMTDQMHAQHGLRAALAMQKTIIEIRPKFLARAWPKLDIGIGLNCGVVNVGDMGSSFRRSYTVMGDHVNLASRLEGLTKEYGVGILVSENIVESVPDVIYRKLDLVRVKGKLAAIGIYEPVGDDGDVADDVLEAIDRFHGVLELYRAQKWDEAEHMLTALSRVDPGRKIYRIYLERIAKLRDLPHAHDWDGVYTFMTK